jgi:dethiobiotin synthetase/malonyl-CoA O-methyltransferase
VRGVFVTGTGTDIGKSWVSAWLVLSWNAAYWKPVQTGTALGCDADLIRQVAPAAQIHDSVYALEHPLSPHAAAARAGIDIRLDAFALPAGRRPLVVEGAGGVLVPLNRTELMADLMRRLGLPIVIVAASGLGTINHTLLTIEALRQRGLEPAGIVMNGPPAPDNRAAIEHFGRVTVVGALPRLPSLDALRATAPLTWQPDS